MKTITFKFQDTINNETIKEIEAVLINIIMDNNEFNLDYDATNDFFFRRRYWICWNKDNYASVYKGWWDDEDECVEWLSKLKRKKEMVITDNNKNILYYGKDL